jgi:CelD/BcsL family acetyltransferase involved in cellulose biosynthesis
VAGRIAAVVGHDLLDLLTARDREYEHRYVGHRCLDLATYWAADAGFARFDLGGFHEYKSHWAPQDGVRWMFSVCPAHLQARRRAENLARTHLRPLKRLVSRQAA